MSAAKHITPVILSGGSGTRLWPVSTDDHPKQFLRLTGPETLFQMTLQRCADRTIFNDPVIVGNKRHTGYITEQMKKMGASTGSIILEPAARNTAPAIALAALACDDPETPLLIMPSDHVIADVDAFLEAVHASLALAQSGWLVTFGIQPTGPETGYGYIQQGEPIEGHDESFATRRFVEKPKLEAAESMLEEGGYYWNAGIFLFTAKAYLSALEKYAPAIFAACSDAGDHQRVDGVFIHPNAIKFAQSPSDSIDYAIMEKAEKEAVTPVNPGWSDVGSWDSLYEIGSSDTEDNVCNAAPLILESSGNLIHSEDIDVAVYGIKDLIIIANGKQVLVLPRGTSQNVKLLAEEMKKRT